MLRTTLLRIAIVALTACVATSCIFFSSPKDRATRRSPSFQEGYSDGCAAATAESSNYREGPLRDEALYKSDSTYRAGWANGYQTCRPDRQGTGELPGANPIPAPVPGH